MFPSVNRVLSLLLTTIATSPSVKKSNSKERVGWWLVTCARKAKVPGPSLAASYAQRWVLCSNNPGNV